VKYLKTLFILTNQMVVMNLCGNSRQHSYKATIKKEKKKSQFYTKVSTYEIDELRTLLHPKPVVAGGIEKYL